MIEQMTLLDKYGAPVTRESTSQAAARSIRAAAPDMRRRVYEYIEAEENHGATRDEIEVALGMPGNTVRPRVKELLAEYRITETQYTRRTRSGRNAVVLVAGPWLA